MRLDGRHARTVKAGAEFVIHPARTAQTRFPTQIASRLGTRLRIGRESCERAKLGRRINVRAGRRCCVQTPPARICVRTPWHRRPRGHYQYQRPAATAQHEEIDELNRTANGTAALGVTIVFRAIACEAYHLRGIPRCRVVHAQRTTATDRTLPAVRRHEVD
jgi:hypothetical protein